MTCQATLVNGAKTGMAHIVLEARHPPKVLLRAPFVWTVGAAGATPSPGTVVSRFETATRRRFVITSSACALPSEFKKEKKKA